MKERGRTHEAAQFVSPLRQSAVNPSLKELSGLPEKFVREDTISDYLKHGNVIALADITELSPFEDLIAQEVDPHYDRRDWVARKKLSDLLRPPKFNGRIADIMLTAIDEPKERLQDVTQRGWKFIKSGNYRPPSLPEEEFKGFTFTANAKSSGRGIIGQIQAELFYYPALSSARAHAHAITRIVTKPKMETQRFLELDETSRIIAFSVLRHEISRPLYTPMRD